MDAFLIVLKAKVNGVRNPALDFRLQFRDREVLKVGFPHEMAYVTEELQPVIEGLKEDDGTDIAP